MNCFHPTPSSSALHCARPIVPYYIKFRVQRESPGVRESRAEGAAVLEARGRNVCENRSQSIISRTLWLTCRILADTLVIIRKSRFSGSPLTQVNDDKCYGGGGMLNPADQEKIRTVIKTHWSIFFAFTTAIIMYTLVLLAVTRGRTIEASPLTELRNAFVLVSLFAGAIKFWIQSRLLSEVTSYETCPNLDKIIEKYWRYNFIMLALCEFPALLGLIIVFMTMRMSEWWLFFVISAILFITSAPRAGRLEGIAEANAARHQSDS